MTTIKLENKKEIPEFKAISLQELDNIELKDEFKKYVDKEGDYCYSIRHAKLKQLQAPYVNFYNKILTGTIVLDKQKRQKDVWQIIKYYEDKILALEDYEYQKTVRFKENKVRQSKYKKRKLKNELKGKGK